MSYLRLNSEPGVIFTFLRVDFKKMSTQWENEEKIFQKCMIWAFINGITLDHLMKKCPRYEYLKLFFGFHQICPQKAGDDPWLEIWSQNKYFCWFLLAKSS